jgi:hypothetical protein
LFIGARVINRANNSIFSRRFSGYLPFAVRPKWPFVRREHASWLWSVPIPRRVMPQDRSTLLEQREHFSIDSPRKESQKFTFYATALSVSRLTGQSRV